MSNWNKPCNFNIRIRLDVTPTWLNQTDDDVARMGRAIATVIKEEVVTEVCLVRGELFVVIAAPSDVQAGTLEGIRQRLLVLVNAVE